METLEKNTIPKEAMSEKKPVRVPDEFEKKIIQNAYRRLLRSIQTPLNPDDKKMIRAAYEVAVDAHMTQWRKSGEPYILHPIAVAQICAEEMLLGPKAIVAALLHDVVEDTDITLKEISEKFGPAIAKIVDGLTKFSKVMKDGEDKPVSPQAENFKKVLLTLADDVRVVLVKMADRLHNMRTMDAMPMDKQMRIASETTYVYAPLAHRLGLYAVKSEFEDLCLKITDRPSYDYVVQKLEETEKDRASYIKKFIQPIKEQVEERYPDLKFRIFGRVKSISSIAKKVRTKQMNFEEIYDVFAVRIVVDVTKENEKPACWQIYSIITDIHTPVPERMKDWIALPKANGYESLHITVMGPQGRFVEVQLRSERMDQTAEKGVAAHYLYKGVGQDQLFDQWLSRVREALQNPQGGNSIDFVNDFKSHLFAEEIYVFTPKGEVKHMTKGATALDFAFEIHSKIGQTCKAVRINKKIVPISYVLQNGDQIEVITHPSQKPTADWLNIAVTGRARSKIKASLNEERRLQAESGKEILDRKLKHIKADFELNVEGICKFFGYGNRQDLLQAIFLTLVDLNELKKLEVSGGKITFEKPTEAIAKTENDEYIAPIAPKSLKGGVKLLVDGQDVSSMKYELSSCCNPVQGDHVFAYTSSKGVLKIHRNSCPNAEHLHATYGYRIKKATWVETLNTSYIAKISIKGIDDLGVVQKLTETITRELKINMRSISMIGEDGFFEGTIGVVINNANQLNHLVKTLKELPGVSQVYRTEDINI